MYITNFTVKENKPVLELSYKAEPHDIHSVEKIIKNIGCYNINLDIDPIGDGLYLINYHYWD